MKLLDPPELFAAVPEPFPANTFCSPDGSWEKVLACPVCGKSGVQILGPPEGDCNGCHVGGRCMLKLSIIFGCDGCGAVFRVMFNQTTAGIWLGCLWARPLVGNAEEDHGE